MALKLTNTLTGAKEEFIPQGDIVTMYICGMTVQGPPHVGHMRAYVTSDVLIRYLKYLGYKLKVIQNFTDIDDKIIERAVQEARDYRIIAKENIDEYFWVADKMNITRADFYPLATQHIQEIIELIQKLFDKGFAYLADGDVYFSVEKFKDYGKLSKKQLEDLVAGARVEIREHKKNPLDFALWKASKAGEPYFYSPWGQGRPGWHIECSAMAMTYLGTTIDFHLGGEDLIFPHHENEIAQSEAATGRPFVRYWIHNAMLNLTGEKMSKSTKHFITAKELLEKYHPNVIRLYFLKSHYRSPQEFDFNLLEENKNAYLRIEDFLSQAEDLGISFRNNIRKDVHETFQKAMNDDLNTPKVIALLFETIKDGFGALNQKALDVVSDKYNEALFYLNSLGFITEKQNRLSFVATTSKGSVEISEKILEARTLARNKKEYEIADLIRKGIEEMGYILEDTEDKTRIKRKG
ncbi:MAG: cysteine--tRNA ligase [candidate division WOR-3 bacterium]|nr:cysteine--tRNA ligase [candidate division WOR-3 bacterium]MCX7757663.1 cysteine--tRNA ligase [candidate division WOR-3 bacterium]MDW7987467.1 cysteine--tRNA ligase [candidate division WOR-3 bacterium]